MNAAKDLLAYLTESESGNGKTPEAESVRAFAWARVSSDQQAERGETITEQLRQIREHAKRHDIEIMDEFQEVASAFQRDEKRVQFHRMIEEAKRRRDVNAILVHDLSRFSRVSLKSQLLTRDLEAAGVRVPIVVVLE